jgi:hypothetical protein
MHYLTFHRKAYDVLTAAEKLLDADHKNHEEVRQAARHVRQCLRSMEIRLEEDAEHSWKRAQKKK